MINFDDIAKENIKNPKWNPNWPNIPDHLYRILIIGRSKSGKRSALFFNLMRPQPDIDKIYYYAKGPNEAKYQLLINKREGLGLKDFNDSKAFIDYSNDISDIYENIDCIWWHDCWYA